MKVLSFVSRHMNFEEKNLFDCLENVFFVVVSVALKQKDDTIAAKEGCLISHSRKL